ncbi:MAG: S41 family peptidase [Rhodospirillaceae bacterium]
MTHFRHLAAAAFLLVLAACAQPRILPTVVEDTGFSHPAVDEVFSAGYEHVSDKYIEALALDDIGLEALRGLGAIDPALSIERADGKIGLYAEGGELIRLKIPDPATPRAWGRLTTQVAVAARGWSYEMRKADPERIYEAVFDGMLSELDIYSRYSGADEARRNRARRDGFGGIGLRFRLDDGEIEIIHVTPETPAAQAGLEEGDVIVSVDGKPMVGLSVREVSKRLRGPVDSQIRLVYREGDTKVEREIVLTRRHIVPQTVTATYSNGILVVRVSSFNQKTAADVKTAVMKHRRTSGARLKGMVLDLTGNPGGLLRQSVTLANLFLTQGHIISTRGRHSDSLHQYNADGEDILQGRPLVVLVDGKSASASEITASALQDRNRAVVVGTSSYGKGSVQTVIRLPNDGELTLTWSRLIAPTGYTLHGLGIHPTVCTSSTAFGLNADRVAQAVSSAAEAIEVFSRWRRPALLTADERSTLRDLCPPERRKDDADLSVAKRIILEKGLFARALTLTATDTPTAGKDPD